jgi:flagellar hook-associated protein 2
MSIGNSAGLSFSGLSSGIDTDGIVSRLMQLERIPLQRIQRRQAQSREKLDVYAALKAQVQSVRNSAGSISAATSFLTTSSSVSNKDIANISTSSGAPIGNFSLKVNKLASADKLISGALTGTGDLNFTGDFKLNDKTISVVASDDLADVAKKINDAKANVSATVINGSDGKSYLTLTGQKTGVENKIKFQEGAGELLTKLGYMTKTGGTDPVIRYELQTSTVGLSSPKPSLSSLLGITGSDATPQDRASFIENLARKGIADPEKYVEELRSSDKATLTINGRELTYRLSNTSLSDLATKITDELGVKAEVKEVVGPNGPQFKIELDGVAAENISDSLGIFSYKKVEEPGTGSYIVKSSAVVLSAANAEFTIDGVALTSAENTVTTAISGATITLLKADPAATTEISVTRSFNQASTMIKGFIDSYNSFVEFSKAATEFNKETFETAALFGDPILNQIESELTSMISAQVPGSSGAYRSLANIGFSFDTGGALKVDEAKFQEALTADPEAIQKLFQPSGSTTGNDIKYVSSTDRSKVSNSPYEVNITRAATKSSFTKQIDASALAKNGVSLTLKSGALTSDAFLSFAKGTSLSQIANTINTDSKTKDAFEASVDSNGRLQIVSKRYGAAGNFTVTASTDSLFPGGNPPNDVKVDGLDVQGTINGEAATGSGQFLTGNKDNATTDGLQILYSGTTTGRVGTLDFKRGVTSQILERLNGYTTGTTGLLSANDTSLQAEIDDFDRQITDFQARLTAKEQVLRARFQAMESAIAAANAQGQRLSSMLPSNSGG